MEEAKERLFSCNACGACYGRGPQNPFRQTDVAPSGFCPMINHFKFESYSARGMSFLARAVYHEDLPVSEGLSKVFYTCTGCAACEEVCKPIPTLSIIKLIRSEIGKTSAQPEGVGKVVEAVKRTFNRFGRNNNDRSWLSTELQLPSRSKTMYFSSCYASFHPSFADSARANVKALRAAGVKLGFLGADQRCCGLTMNWSGSQNDMEILAKHNVKAMKAAGAERIVFDCPECYSTWSNAYPDFVGKMPFELIHVSELFAELLESGKMTFKNEIKRKVTYHDPCHLARHMHVTEEPRKVLESLPGIELVETEKTGRWTYCCGSGSGIVLYAYPEYSKNIGLERLGQIQNVAKEVVTTCPWCIDQMKLVAQKEKLNIKVIDLSLLVAEAMGI